MSAPTYYIKSLDSDHSTKTLKGEEKVVCQTLTNIVTTKKIKPNTKSFGHSRRLSTTIISENYFKTYRPQGIIFTTRARPAYVIPFDLVLLTKSDQIVTHYYLMEDKLHQFYRHPLLPGYERFLFKNLDDLVRHFPSPIKAWQAANAFRLKSGQPHLPKSKFRLCSYNEAIFTKSITIEPVAIFGYRPTTKKLARSLGLPYFRSAQEFHKRHLLRAP